MIKKYKLALIGGGYLSEIIATALEVGHLPEYELVGVLGRNSLRTESFARRHDCKACYSIEELMELRPDFTAEAASPQAILDYTEEVLQSGSNLVVLSIGAFADAPIYEKVKEVARETGNRIYIASGAVGGFDVLRTAALMSPIKATMTSKKSLHSLYYTPLNKVGLMNIEEPSRSSADPQKKPSIYCHFISMLLSPLRWLVPDLNRPHSTLMLCLDSVEMNIRLKSSGRKSALT